MKKIASFVLCGALAAEAQERMSIGEYYHSDQFRYKNIRDHYGYDTFGELIAHYRHCIDTNETFYIG